MVSTEPRQSGNFKKPYLIIKRVFEILFSLMVLFMMIPLLAFWGLLIKITSSGPVFYKQKRVGRGGKVFELIKLRTMHENAEKTTGPIWAQDPDPRVTLIGQYLRRKHFDEIPQLLNVLKGEMSLIGPRPERESFVKQLSRIIPNYTKRLQIRPGITGLAQISYKYDETTKDVKRKVAYDLLYIRKMCLGLDLKILFLTIKKLILAG